MWRLASSFIILSLTSFWRCDRKPSRYELSSFKPSNCLHKLVLSVSLAASCKRTKKKYMDPGIIIIREASLNIDKRILNMNCKILVIPKCWWDLMTHQDIKQSLIIVNRKWLFMLQPKNKNWAKSSLSIIISTAIHQMMPPLVLRCLSSNFIESRRPFCRALNRPTVTKTILI